MDKIKSAKLITDRGRRVILRVAVFGSILVACLWIVNPVVREQHRNMALAKEHSLVLKRLVLNDERFKHVIILDGGTTEKIFVLGYVKTNSDLTVLQKLVSESEPPRPVEERVVVEPLAFEQ